MTISSKEQEFLHKEDAILGATREKIAELIQDSQNRLKKQSQLARELTTSIVNTTRNEDKQAFASDEAVAHGLAHKSLDDIDGFKEQIQEPYFARIELLEETPNGEEKLVEYKLGKRANPDCRIIDWRKAPIAKLYYEYSEGEIFYEEIQERERTGEIKLKNSYEIKNGIISSLNCRYGQFHKDTNGWEKRTDETNNARQDYSSLPDILSLITAEQFQSITQTSAVLIQGVAGSGKTAVAIHRALWLLHEDNSDFQERELCFVLKSPLLKKYVQNSLKEYPNIPVFTYEEYIKKTGFSFEVFPEKPPMAINRFLGSAVLANNINNIPFNEETFPLDLASWLEHNYQELVDTLIDKELILNSARRIRYTWGKKQLDLSTISLFALRAEIANPQKLNRHLIIDEVQDFSAVELGLILQRNKDPLEATLAGDINQQIDFNIAFPGWSYLQAKIGLSPESLVKLTVSHRSTLEIMKVADAIIGREDSGGRSGKKPVWFNCNNEEKAVALCIQWLKLAQEKFPAKITAVICKDQKAAKMLYSYLEPEFASALKLGDSSYSFDEGILVTDLSKVKGLEFYNVLIWDLSAKTYPDNELSRHQLYVACTRAEQNLALVSTGKNPEFYNKIKLLVRNYS